MNPVWEERLRRATALSALWPFATERLRFFRALTSFQRDVYHQLRSSGPGRGLDAPRLAAYVPNFLEMVEAAAPAETATLAARLLDRDESEWEEMIRACWKGAPGHEVFAFFPRAILQPWAMLLADRWRADVGALDPSEAACPFCSRPPVVGAVNGVRTLTCSLCSTTWTVDKATCPHCREARPDRLRRDGVAEIPWMCIESCLTCGHYLKSVDHRIAPEAVAVVDEIAALPLDRLARDRGFAKLELNVVGA